MGGLCTSARVFQSLAREMLRSALPVSCCFLAEGEEGISRPLADEQAWKVIPADQETYIARSKGTRHAHEAPQHVLETGDRARYGLDPLYR